MTATKTDRRGAKIAVATAKLKAAFAALDLLVAEYFPPGQAVEAQDSYHGRFTGVVTEHHGSEHGVTLWVKPDDDRVKTTSLGHALMKIDDCTPIDERQRRKYRTPPANARLARPPLLALPLLPDDDNGGRAA